MDPHEWLFFLSFHSGSCGIQRLLRGVSQVCTSPFLSSSFFVLCSVSSSFLREKTWVPFLVFSYVRLHESDAFIAIIVCILGVIIVVIALYFLITRCCRPEHLYPFQVGSILSNVYGAFISCGITGAFPVVVSASEMAGPGADPAVEGALGARPPLPPRFLQNHAVFGQF